MTAPALILTASGARNDASALILQRLKRRLRELRPAIHSQIAFVGGAEPSMAPAIAALAKHGIREAVCVPLDCAHLSTPPRAVVDATRAARSQDADVTVTVADSVGATPALFATLDQRLRQALGRRQSRELDGLVLLHDGSDDPTDVALMSRRARAWSHRHHLPVTVAGLAGCAGASAAVTAHAHAGRRHVGVGWLSVLDDPGTRAQLEADPRVAAVAAPLDAEQAVADAVLASYGVAAVKVLPFDAAVA